MKPLTIVLVEDEKSTCERFIDEIEKFDNLSLVGITNNDLKAIEYIKDFLPDILILDLELHFGSGSGLNVLWALKYLPLNNKPYVIVTTNNSSQTTYESARELGADYIMSKHQENYSEKFVLNFLNMISSAICNRKPKSNNDINVIPKADRKKRIIRRIMSELNSVGISQKSVGYKYLVDAIINTIEEPSHNLCCIIAKKYNKTESSVERAMQNAINRAWATSDIDDLIKNYTAKISSAKGVPTLTEFIYYYANKINSEY